jgi:hypothetical protein
MARNVSREKMMKEIKNDEKHIKEKRNNNYEVRKHILLHLLTYTGNQTVANIPEGVRDYLQRYISLTNKNQ